MNCPLSCVDVELYHQNTILAELVAHQQKKIRSFESTIPSQKGCDLANTPDYNSSLIRLR